MDYIQDIRGNMNRSDDLRDMLTIKAKDFSSKNDLQIDERNSAVIFKAVNGNIYPESYANIEKQSEWKKRTEKIHPHFGSPVHEMQSSNSSDALLMTIFCHPQILVWKGVRELLALDEHSKIEYGWNPKFENEDVSHPTEIDMRIGSKIFEAKLTEDSFTEKEMAIVESYKNFDSVFIKEAIPKKNGKYCGYQLIRNILTAVKYNYSFYSIVHEMRYDLIMEYVMIISAIRDYENRKRCNVLSWQEIAEKCGKDLKAFLDERYF